MKGSDAILEMAGITKIYPASGVRANDRVDFTLHQGEIHAILGQNGAGKTTLMDILYGLVEPDEGVIRINGKEVTIRNPQDAIRQGIGMVHQHFMLALAMTVWENVVAGREPRKFGFFDRGKAKEQVEKLSRQFNLQVDPEATIRDLPVGIQQRVEILKALYRNVQILILDEPTAFLTPQETEELFGVMRSLTKQGMSIIFITHKLKEVFTVADRITVLRDGRVVETTVPKETSEEKLAAIMVGREINTLIKKKSPQLGESVLVIEGLRVVGDRKELAVDGVSLKVHAGEIVGIVGMPGNGQTELVEALTGLRLIEAGEVWIPKKVSVGYIPEDRQRDGLVLSHTVTENLGLRAYRCPPYSRGSIVNWRAVADFAQKLVETFSIVTPSVSARTSILSGGNLQRLVVARECSGGVEFLIASQPTRGLDVAATRETHQLFLELRQSNCGILLVSAELDEVMGLSDRIMVMSRGKLLIPPEEATKEEIGLLMMGGSLQDGTSLAFNK